MCTKAPFPKFVPLASIAIFILSGCAAPQPQYRAPSSYSTPTPSSSFNPSIATHTYTVTVVNSSGQPVKGATFEWKTDANGVAGTQASTTDDKGVTTINLYVQPKLNTSIKWADYKSTASYKVKKDEYFEKSGTLTVSNYKTETGGREATPKNEKIVLILPTDYLAHDFVQSKQYAQLSKKVLDFLTVIRLESLLNQSDLKLHGIRMQEFKGKRYLTFEVNSDNVFNSLKLDRYAVGKNVFDETVRKILNPLNQKISDQKLFFGYNIIVNTRTKNFTQEYAVGDPLKYEFMMPQTSVNSYKDKDISGQKLIDQSIVLLNDERIDLKFQ